MQAPTWLYHAEHAPRVFGTAEDIEAAIAEGWVDHPDSVGEPEDPDTEREELLALAKESGVKIDKRWSNEKIREAINKA